MEAGYRCGNPACGTILTLDIHHIEAVADGGDDDASNLLPLCPNCHAQYERGIIPKEAIHHWKRMLTALNHAFDREAMDLLLFLHDALWSAVYYSTDGVTRFAGLIVAGLVRALPHPATPKEVMSTQLIRYRYLHKLLKNYSPEMRIPHIDDLRRKVADKPKPEDPRAAEAMAEVMAVLDRLEESIRDTLAGYAADGWDGTETDSTQIEGYRPLLFSLELTIRGERLVDAWVRGDEKAYVASMAVPTETDGAGED